jgi:hypothetical protein
VSPPAVAPGAGDLLGEAGNIATPRLQLYPAGREAIEALEWLPAALAPEWQLDDLLPYAVQGRAVLIRRQGIDVGVVAAGLATAGPGTVEFRFIGIDPAERFRGLGGEAALGLERFLQGRAPGQTFLAAVPEQRGLAVYFWLRLGYRQLVRAGAHRPVNGLRGDQKPCIWIPRGPHLEH